MPNLNTTIEYNPIPVVRNIPFQNLTGQRFYRLQVIAFYGYDKHAPAWLCRCDCGQFNVVRKHPLLVGKIKSCGCLQREFSHQNRIHGESRTPEYRAYTAAKKRCNQKNTKGFHNYGGRGIEFRFNSYRELIDDIGYRPSNKHSLDRIDNDGHYEKGNVRWATCLEQSRNRRVTLIYTIGNEHKPLAEWCDIYHVSYASAQHLFAVNPQKLANLFQNRVEAS